MIKRIPCRREVVMLPMCICSDCFPRHETRWALPAKVARLETLLKETASRLPVAHRDWFEKSFREIGSGNPESQE